MTFANTRPANASLPMIVKSALFKKGVADFHAGRWSEVFGLYRGRFYSSTIYEVGRLTAAATGSRAPGVADVRAARELNAFPNYTR